MIVFSRKFYAAVTGATVAASLAFGIFAGVNLAGSLPSHDNVDQVTSSSQTISAVDAGWVIGKPVKVTKHRRPNRQELRELAEARKMSGLKCHLEWDGPIYPGYETICG
jgi:hypothetical protein